MSETADVRLTETELIALEGAAMSRRISVQQVVEAIISQRLAAQSHLGIDELAELLREIEAAPQIAADPRATIETRNWTREANTILASDWLAQVKATARAEAWDEGVAAASGYALSINPYRSLGALDGGPAFDEHECGATTTVLGKQHVCTRPRDHASHQDGKASWAGDDRQPVPLDEALDRLADGGPA